MSIYQDKAVVHRFLHALSEGNFEALQVHPGLYQTVRRQPLVRAAFPDLTISVEQQIGESDTIATRATMRGTHLGPFMGAAPTGRELTWNVLLMDRVVDGKIVLHYAIADWMKVLAAAGLVASFPAAKQP